MQIKKFEASTLQEALDTIKRELGPEAIILQTKRHRRGFGLLSKKSVEVTAAVSERSIRKQQIVQTRLPEKTKATLNQMPAKKQADIYDQYIDKHLEKMASKTKDRVEVRGETPRRITATRYIDIVDEAGAGPEKVQEQAVKTPVRSPVKAYAAAPSSLSVLEAEMKELRSKIEEIQRIRETQGGGGGAQALYPSSVLSSPALQECFEQLVVNGIEKRLALDLARRVGFELGQSAAADSHKVLDEVASEIMRGMEVMALLDGIQPGHPTCLALVGPTGVGKTTTAAKIASEALHGRKLKVALVNYDVLKPTAFDQLATYAKILNIPFRSAATLSDLKGAMNELQSMDLVIVDTTGHSQRDTEALKEMESGLQELAGVRTVLVCSSTTRDAELYETVQRFSVFRPQGLILTKLDEATLYGSIYNICQKTRLPICYFTVGQRVPEDLEVATPERAAALILDL